MYNFIQHFYLLKGDILILSDLHAVVSVRLMLPAFLIATILSLHSYTVSLLYFITLDFFTLTYKREQTAANTTLVSVSYTK